MMQKPLLVSLIAALVGVTHVIMAQTPTASPDTGSTGKDHCVTAGFGISPTISLVDATTKQQTLSGGIAIFVSHPNTCGVLQRLYVLTNSKYDSKQKQNAPANITRHHNVDAQYLIQPSSSSPYFSLSGSLLADNSLGLHLQQTYAATIGGRRSWQSVDGEVSAGAAFVTQDFATADTSTRFIAPMYILRMIYQHGGGATNPAFRLDVMRRHVVAISGRPGQTTFNATASVPTMFQVLSLDVKAWRDGISNPPSGLKNHYLSVEFGPKFAVGTLP